tara:strand:- start:761 stop:1516 length:756 start_codon:yes stop_codon:yes gene_type:complete
MATDQAAKDRKREVSDVSFTATPPDTKDIRDVDDPKVIRDEDVNLEFADQEYLSDKDGRVVIQTLSPQNFNTKAASHDEDTTYKELFLNNVSKDRFQPPKPSGEPAPDIYVKLDDDAQFDAPEYVETDCKCADGSKSTGKKNVRTGQIDCDCNKNLATTPDVYNPPPNKKRVVDNKPLRDQAGVSYMGNVSLDPCKVQDNATEERAAATLNHVIQTDQEDIPRGKSVNHNTVVQKSLSIYDTCDYDIYGIF